MKVAVIGAGSWGTAVAWMLGKKGVDTILWARSDEVTEGIRSSRANPRYLSDVQLPDAVKPTSDLEEAASGRDVLVIATPSHAVREIASVIAPYVGADTALVSIAKGLEQESLLRMTEVLGEALGGLDRTAALSGPNHAEEVSRGIPSTTVIAAYDDSLGRALQELFTSGAFRVYTNSDVVGVELCGASKNVIAVAAGMSDGLGYGDNTKAALMTRGLAEMSRLGVSLKARPLTYMGLAGMGDLIVTCTSAHSRNRGLGESVARGGTVEEFYERTHMVAEGARAAVTVDELGKRTGVELPITHLVRRILYEGIAPSAAQELLMTRTMTDELHGLGLLDEGGLG